MPRTKLLLAGTRFGKLIILKRVENDSRGNTQYECACDCGNKCVVCRPSLVGSDTRSCGCLKKESDTTGKYSPPGQTSFNYLFDMYQRNAKKRDIFFELTKEYFSHLITLNCGYCGENPKPFNRYVTGLSKKISAGKRKECVERAWILINGIDRIDNGIGYTVANCAPCCWDCNEMKMQKTEAKFIDHVNKIHKFQQSGIKWISVG